MSKCVQCIRLDLFVVLVQQNESDTLAELVVESVGNGLRLEGVFSVEVGSAVAELVAGHTEQVLRGFGTSLVWWALLHF